MIKDQFQNSLSDYHSTITRIYGLSKTPKPGIPLQPIISRIGNASSPTPHEITNCLAKMLSQLWNV